MGSQQNLLPDPITGFCVVSEKSKCPNGYHLIDKTQDGQDADLSHGENFFSISQRYLCITRHWSNEQFDDVMMDIAVRKEGEAGEVPPGYLIVNGTLDSNKAVLRKKRFIVKMIPRKSIHDDQLAICDLILLGNKSKQVPPNYKKTIRVNSFLVYVKYGPVPQLAHNPCLDPPPTVTHNELPYPLSPTQPNPPLMHQCDLSIVEGTLSSSLVLAVALPIPTHAARNDERSLEFTDLIYKKIMESLTKDQYKLLKKMFTAPDKIPAGIAENLEKHDFPDKLRGLGLLSETNLGKIKEVLPIIDAVDLLELINDYERKYGLSNHLEEESIL